MDSCMENFEYDSTDDRENYLRDFYNDHEDEPRFSARPSVLDKWGVDGNGDPAYAFEAAGQRFDITTYKNRVAGHDVFDIQFSDEDGRFSVTGKGGVAGAAEVFKKVSTAVTALLRKKDLPIITFSAAETHKDNPNISHTSRQRMYDRLVKTIAKLTLDYGAMAACSMDGTKHYVVAKKDLMPEVKEKFLRVSGEPEVLASLEQEGWMDIAPEIQDAWFLSSGWELELDFPIEL